MRHLSGRAEIDSVRFGRESAWEELIFWDQSCTIRAALR